MSLRPSNKICVIAMAMLSVSTTVWACGGYGIEDSRQTSELISELGHIARNPGTHGSQQEASRIIATLRTRGPQSLTESLEYLQYRTEEASSDADLAALGRLEQLVDKVAGQKFATQSGLYWHTSLVDAQTEADKRDLPILSLRMLGRLDEDLSCANSRFFRTTLYPDPVISSLLRERFVLHWKPVRDVPVVIIDFGNGRQLRRPLTGNSVHLVLDQRGLPIDALPGLVSPESFANWLSDAGELFSRLETEDPAAANAIVADFHHQRAERRRGESSLAIGPQQSVSDLNPFDPRWDELSRQSNPVNLTLVAQQLLEDQLPRAEAAMPLAITKSGLEFPFLRLVDGIEPQIARDTVFNQYALQTKIDDWFTAPANAPPPAVMGYDEFTDRIYSEVFLMPLDDPWLGLSSETNFAALDNGGRIEAGSILEEQPEQSTLVWQRSR